LDEYSAEQNGFQGGFDGRPFWNVHSSQFIYNPKLCFPITPGAKKYVFTATDENGNEYKFESKKSISYLTEIWKDLPTGMTTLKVDAYDKDDNFICVAGVRTFFKCDPFPGRENLPPKAYSYRECALKAYRYAYNDKATQYLLKNGKPDPDYSLNLYPSKMLASIITSMLTYAKLEPETAQNAILIAKKAADYLIDVVTYKDGTPLAGLPYTYSTEHLREGQEPQIGAAKERMGNVMMIYPCTVAEAYFALSDVTGDRKYYDAAVKIAEVYKNNVLPNGSWYLFLSATDGKPQAENYCVPNAMLPLFSIMYEKTGDKVWKDISEGCYAYIEKTCIDGYDWEGQFEDTVFSTRHENMTHFIAISVIKQIAKERADDPKSVDMAVSLMRFIEDQFVVWGRYSPWCRSATYRECWESPAGLEQYEWYVPVDSSTSAIAEAFFTVYELTGDRLWYEKACALLDMITRMQNEETGLIPTQWITENPKTKIWSFWINCHLIVARRLYELSNKTEE